MPSTSIAPRIRARLHPLAASLALASAVSVAGPAGDLSATGLAVTVAAQRSAASGFAVRPVRSAARALPHAGGAAATAAITRVVQTCADSLVVPSCATSDGTLRQALSCAQDNDTIDLTQLQCSTITLTAPLTTGPVSLTLNGPGKDKLSIAAGGPFRTLVHNGLPTSTMTISGLTLANGHHENPYSYGGGGGCIYSSGNLALSASTVTACFTSATRFYATGGAIFAKGTASLDRTEVSNSTARTFGNNAGLATFASRGGGVYANTVRLTHSTISGNQAIGPGAASGGGIRARYLYGYFSTVSNNTASTYAGSSEVSGGCIYARANVFLTRSTIASCSAAGTLSAQTVNGVIDASGGAIAAIGTATLVDSDVTGSTASAADVYFSVARAGGVSAKTVDLLGSTVSGNTALATRSSKAGGVLGTTVYSTYSTISGNSAGDYAGIQGTTVTLVGSTVSGNRAVGVKAYDNGSTGGVAALGSASVFNSTIVNNSGGGGVPSAPGGLVAAALTLQSSIVAGNKTGANAFDVGPFFGATLDIAGHDDLVQVAGTGTTLPAATISDDPQLGPLQDNGGLTRTHALTKDSPAIDKGNNSLGLQFDQSGLPRVIDSRADIGAAEFDPDRVFIGAFNL